MTLKRFGTQTSAPTGTNTSMVVAPPAELRSELPWYRRVGVNWAVSAVKANQLQRVEEHKALTAAELEIAATNNLAEHMMLQMEADAVMVTSQIGTQLSARVAQAQFAYQGLHMDIFENHLRQRYEFLTRLEALAKEGVISTPQELADAKQYIYGFIQMGMDNSTETTQTALLALKAHADKAFTHIARMSQN